MNRCNILS